MVSALYIPLKLDKNKNIWLEDSVKENFRSVRTPVANGSA